MEERNWNDPAYKKLRAEVLKRDEYTCQWPNCGSNERLYVHHIRKWSTHPELRFVVGNCIALCWTHHNFIWSREEDYENLFYSIIHRRKYDRRPRQQSKTKTTSRSTANKKKKAISQTYASRYARAKEKARRKRKKGK